MDWREHPKSASAPFWNRPATLVLRNTESNERAAIQIESAAATCFATVRRRQVDQLGCRESKDASYR
jgi:hypothetical protein